MRKLTNILNMELDAFNRFFALLDQQHEHIVCRNLDGLNKVNSELDLLSDKTRNLEKERIRIVGLLSKELKLCDENLKLQDLLPHLDTVSSDHLKLLREEILNAHKQIEEKSLRNKQLIKKSRELISESMKIITSRPSPVYKKPGPSAKEVNEGRLINRSV